MESINKLLKSRNAKDIVILSRYFYAEGINIISDSMYDKLIKYFMDNEPDWEYCKRTWSDDPTPYELLNKYGFSIPKVEVENIDEIMSEEHSMSIRPVTTFDEAWEWFQDKLDLELIFSIKADGINTKNLYKKVDDNNWVYYGSRTRGRKGNNIDVTKNLSNVLPQVITIKGDTSHLPDNIWTRNEVYVQPSDLPTLRKKYNREDSLITPRGAGISMMRSEYNKEDFKYLHSTCFRTNIGDNVAESIQFSASHGFESMPYIVVNNLPKDRGRFLVELNKIMTELWQLSLDFEIPSDGIVVEVNQQVSSSKMGFSEQYRDCNLALKFNEWSSDQYTSVVKKIHVMQISSVYSFVLEVEPVITKSGATITRVNGFNLGILQRNKIYVGSEVRFEYKSENAVDLIYD